jgi:hypothetical protein
MTKKEVSDLLNDSNDNYYIYALCRPNGEPFYIGKGTVNGAGVHRVLSHWGMGDKKDKNKIKHKIIKEIKAEGKTLRYKILRFFKKEEDAFTYEIKKIFSYGRINNNTGILANLDDGGRGGYGAVFTEEMRTEQSNRVKKYYEEHPEARLHNSIKTKEWNAKHPEEVLERTKKCAKTSRTEGSREKSRVGILLFYEKNPEMKEHLANKTREWVRNNPEKEAERRTKAKATLSSEEERKKNSDRRKRWFRDNPEKASLMIDKSIATRAKRTTIRLRCLDFIKKHGIDIVAPDGRTSISIWQEFEEKLYGLEKTMCVG